jgi:hypothetical protein
MVEGGLEWRSLQSTLLTSALTPRLSLCKRKQQRETRNNNNNNIVINNTNPIWRLG